MPDTKRSFSELQQLLADNVEGLISPQRLRDAAMSLRPNYGRISQQNNGAATVIEDTTNWHMAAFSGTALHSLADDFDMPTNGRLRYIGATQGLCVIMATVSVMVTGGNVRMCFRLGVNGSPDSETEIEYHKGTGQEIPSITITMIAKIEQNDFVELFIRNASNTNNITITYFSLQAIGYIA